MKVVVVGCGKMGERHARTLHRMGLEVGLVDVDQVRLERLATELGNSQGPFRAAIVAVPTTQHFDLAYGLISKGMHVLVEKPVAQYASEAIDLVERARWMGTVLHVGHIERFNPAFRRLAAAVKAPVIAEISRCSVENGRCLDVHVVHDLMIHDLDLLISMLGMPLWQKAKGSADDAEAHLHFPCGSDAYLRASRVHDENVREWHTIYVDSPHAEDGYLRADLLAEKAPLEDELAHFLDAVQQRRLDYEGAIQAADSVFLAEDIVRQVSQIRMAA